MRTWPASLLLSGLILAIESERDGSVTQGSNGWLVPTRVNSSWQFNSSHTPISYTLHLVLTASNAPGRNGKQVKKGADRTSDVPTARDA